MRDVRMTQRVMFEAIKAMAENSGNINYTISATDKAPAIEVTADDVIEFCKERTEKLVRKTSSGANDKKSAEHIEIQNSILEVLADNVARSATDIAKALDKTPQRITPQLRKLCEEGKVKNFKDKRASMYQLA